MGKILIIDDEQAIRNDLRDRIELMGHQVDDAGCVEEALNRVNEIAYDCVLLDLAIPRSFEGPTSTNYGQTLLHRIASLINAPPVLVITANGLDGWQLAASVLENGAKGFIAKPFENQVIEEKIRIQLNKRHREIALDESKKEPFSGGDLVMHEDRIELCGIEVGGTRGNALIRQILRLLARETQAGRNTKASGKALANAIGGDTAAPTITNAIKEFRDKCSEKLGCGQQDVIATHRGGGYRLNDKIVFRLGSEGRQPTQADAYQSAILREIRASGELTARQIADRTRVPLFHVEGALSRLDDEQKVSLKGSGANAVYSIRETAT